MRSLLFSALLASVAVVTLPPGRASAQPAQAYSRPNYYAPSNFGMSRPSYYRPSNFGMSRPSFGMPNPSRYVPSFGTLDAATPVPVHLLPSLPSIPIPSNAPPPPATAPAPGTEEVPPAATYAPGNYGALNGSTPAPDTSETPPAGISAPGDFATPYASPSVAAPLSYGGYPSGGYLSSPGYSFAPSYTYAPASGSAAPVPRYEPSFYSALRRVYGYPER